MYMAYVGYMSIIIKSIYRTDLFMEQNPPLLRYQPLNTSIGLYLYLLDYQYAIMSCAAFIEDGDYSHCTVSSYTVGGSRALQPDNGEKGNEVEQWYARSGATDATRRDEGTT